MFVVLPVASIVVILGPHDCFLYLGTVLDLPAMVAYLSSAGYKLSPVCYLCRSKLLMGLPALYPVGNVIPIKPPSKVAESPLMSNLMFDWLVPDAMALS